LRRIRWVECGESALDKKFWQAHNQNHEKGKATYTFIFMKIINYKPNEDVDQFVATVADPGRRSTAIADATRRRNKSLWIVSIVTLGFFALCFFGSRQPDGFFVFFVCLTWMLLFKYESDLTLLRVIERLQSDEKLAA
jgi:hypothetical protein